MHVRALLATLGLVVVLPHGPAAGQTGPDMNDLVVDWATGRYASPVMCEIGGELVRGVRRVILRPHHTLGRPTRLAVHFIDMKPGEATRCIDSTGAPQPNVQGKLLLGVPGTPHPETATRDFKRALQRDKGFVLEVTEGVLKMQDVAVPRPSPRLVDYRGGKASLRRVLPATDAERELAPFPSPRKLVLIVESEGHTPLELPIFLASDDPV
jgi:hypothetical protein